MGTSRLIGTLLLIEMVLGYVVNMTLMSPIITVAPGYIVNAAANGFDVGLSVMLGLGGGVVSLALAVILYPVVRRFSQPMALALVALAAVDFSLAAVEQATVLSMLSLSQAYAKANGANEATYQLLRVVVGSARNWAHYVHLIVAGVSIFVFYASLFRFALVPRVLGAAGMLAAISQMTAVSMPVFGQAVVFPMLAPLGLCHLALALWLLTKGFSGGTTPAAGAPPLRAALQ